MRTVAFALLIAFLMPVAMAHAEEAAPAAAVDYRELIENRKAAYNDEVLALEDSYNAGTIDKHQYMNGIIAANDQLVSDLAPLKAQLAE